MAITYFQNFSDEIKIFIFRYVRNPIGLVISCKSWSNIAKDSQMRAEWVIYNFGRAHALFHAVRLGPTFINLSVARAIIVKRGILSRYFIQRLLTQFGSYDPKLIELKIEAEMSSIDVDRFTSLKRKARAPWASNLQLPVLTYLLEEASKSI